jgi:hypothetical protein
MIVKMIEVTNNDLNWGKFMLLRPDTEWSRLPTMDPSSRTPLLRQIGWTPEHVWVLDLQTGEGACFRPGGIARADLLKHKIWCCPMYEPFLEWLYRQDLADITALPDMVNLSDAKFEMWGYRRPGPAEEDKGLAAARKLLEELGQQEAENRRKLLETLTPGARELAIKAFADLGLTQ